MISKQLQELGKKRIAPYPCEGFLLGGGNEEADILFVGEAPGRDELQTHRPFTGRAGANLTGFLKEAGLNREDIYITSVVRSRPYKHDVKSSKKPIEERGNRTPTQKEIVAHAPLLDEMIKQLDPKLIVTLGAIALKRLVGPSLNLQDVHGKPFCTRLLQLPSLESSKLVRGERQQHVFPTFHPASVFYNPTLATEITNDMRQLRSVLDWLHEQG